MLDVLPTSFTDSCPDACLIEYNTQHVFVYVFTMYCIVVRFSGSMSLARY